MKFLLNIAVALALPHTMFPSDAAVSDELKIGVIIPQAGPAANLGASVFKAPQLRPKEIDGTQMSLIVRD